MASPARLPLALLLVLLLLLQLPLRLRRLRLRHMRRRLCWSLVVHCVPVGRGGRGRDARRASVLGVRVAAHAAVLNLHSQPALLQLQGLRLRWRRLPLWNMSARAPVQTAKVLLLLLLLLVMVLVMVVVAVAMLLPAVHARLLLLQLLLLLLLPPAASTRYHVAAAAADQVVLHRRACA